MCCVVLQKTNEWSNIDVRGVANKTIVLRPIKLYIFFRFAIVRVIRFMDKYFFFLCVHRSFIISFSLFLFASSSSCCCCAECAPSSSRAVCGAVCRGTSWPCVCTQEYNNQSNTHRENKNEQYCTRGAIEPNQAIYVYWYAVYWSGSGGKMDLVMEKTNATHCMYHLDVWRRKLENVNVSGYSSLFFYCSRAVCPCALVMGKNARDWQGKGKKNKEKNQMGDFFCRTQKESMENPLSKNCEFLDFQ